MYQIILILKKLNFWIFQKINNIELEKILLFDKIKNVNQINTNCTKIKNALEQNKKTEIKCY